MERQVHVSLRRRPWVAALVSGAAVLTASAASSASASDLAPRLQVRGGGHESTDGTRLVRVSKVRTLDPRGETITVAGRGFDPGKGIYVALCRVRDRSRPPRPCGGGADRTGTGGASAWISSNPPPYGEGLAVPYRPGGRFRVRLTVAARLTDGLDCRRVLCAVATRNDHTRTTDRSQDVLVPVTFRGGSSPVRPGGDLALPAGRGGLDPRLLAIGAGALVLAAVGALGIRHRRRGRA
jgi:hypothetical protein